MGIYSPDPEICLKTVQAGPLRLIARYLAEEQLSLTFPPHDAADKMRRVGSAIRFYASFRAKRGSESTFVWLGGEGMYRLKSETEVDMEQIEGQDEAVEEQINIEYEGWIYAFAFLRSAKRPSPSQSKSGSPPPLMWRRGSMDSAEGRDSLSGWSSWAAGK